MKSNLITTYLKMMKMLESTYLLPKHDMQVFLRSKPNILNNESALNNPYNERYINFNHTLFIKRIKFWILKIYQFLYFANFFQSFWTLNISILQSHSRIKTKLVLVLYYINVSFHVLYQTGSVIIDCY